MNRAPTIVFCFLFLSLAFSSMASAASKNFSFGRAKPAPIVIESPLKTIPVGERLVFDVYWMGFHVGEGSLEVKEKVEVRGHPAYHIVAAARTNDFLSAIYPVRDEIHSFVDAERFCSLEFRKTLREGRYRADESIVFDHDKKKGFYESFLNKGKKEVDIPAGVHDIVSAFYWFRLQEVKENESVHATVSSEEKNWDVELRVTALEKKELRGERVIDTILVEPKTRLKGVLYDRGRAWIYFSADKKRIPVWITIRTPFGPVFGVLRRSGSQKS